MQEKEEWRDIAGYEGYYQVSNLGNVRSLTRRVSSFRSDIGKRFEYDKKGQLIQPIASAGGYLTVVLSKDGKKSTFLIHELVARAFLEKKDGFHFVEHKNRVFTDNVVSNLIWSKEDESSRPKVLVSDNLNDVTNEEWRDVVGYEGLYEVCRSGFVRSVERLRSYIHNMSKRTTYHKSGGKILKGHLDSYGYLRVGLWDGKKVRTVPVHRIVAEAFIDNPSNLPCVDHINTIKSDNRVNNLRWVSQKQNSNNVVTIQHLHKDRHDEHDCRSVSNLTKKENYNGKTNLRATVSTASLSNKKKDGALLEIRVLEGCKICDFWFSEGSLRSLRDEISEYLEEIKVNKLCEKN